MSSTSTMNSEGSVEQLTEVLLIGKPNCGKSLLFQKLTGFYQKVANFPGVTVEVKRGSVGSTTWVDFPGAYSLNPVTHDEETAISALKKELTQAKVAHEKKVIVCVLDGTQLERSLILALQARELARVQGRGMVFAVNMIDEIRQLGAKLDLSSLAEAVEVPVVGISAKTGEGLDELQKVIKEAETAPQKDLLKDTTSYAFAKKLSDHYGLKNDVYVNKRHWMDKVLLSNLLGGVIFLSVMLVLFQAIFSWAQPLMEGTEELVGWLGALVTAQLPAGAMRDFVNDAIFGGLGSFVVFAPQIAVLTLIIGLLEDSGYLARASVIGHIPLKIFGLSGKSFVPYLSGHACAIPAIMAARTIESPKKRLITILTVPFTTCSARLPVYALLVSAFIPQESLWGGFVTWQGVVFFGLYFMGILSALLVSAVLNKTMGEAVEDAPFIIELPRYRVPSWRPLLKKSLSSAWLFVKKAGPIIFTVNFMIWVLGYFPHNEAGLAGSYLGQLGRFINPIFEPLGLDWRYGVAILVSFLAREVFVGTLGTLFGIEGADENVASLASKIKADGLGFESGMALLVFYALAMQCVSTLAVIKSETGSKKLPVFVFIGYTLLAYVGAVLAYHLF